MEIGVVCRPMFRHNPVVPLTLDPKILSSAFGNHFLPMPFKPHQVQGKLVFIGLFLRSKALTKDNPEVLKRRRRHSFSLKTQLLPASLALTLRGTALLIYALCQQMPIN